MRYWIRMLLVGAALLSGCVSRLGNTALLNDKIAVSEKAEYYKVQLEAMVRDSISAVPYTNWKQFRTAFFNCKLENPDNFGVPSQAAVDLMNARQEGYQAKYAKIANDILERDFTSISAHNELANNLSIYPKVREFHAAVRDALLKSIINSGNGTTVETAMYVISVAEEYEVLHAMGLISEGQSLLQKGKHHYDVIKARDEAGTVREVYFAIDEFYGMFY